jgi:hypothetical protein
VGIKPFLFETQVQFAERVSDISAQLQHRRFRQPRVGGVNNLMDDRLAAILRTEVAIHVDLANAVEANTVQRFAPARALDEREFLTADG